MKIFVGNLSRRVTQDTLQELFETFGQVASAEIIKDKFSGESKGFAFVEMPSKSEAEAAMSGLNGRMSQATKPHTTTVLASSAGPGEPGRSTPR